MDSGNVFRPSSRNSGVHTGEKTTGVTCGYQVRDLNLQNEIENGKLGYVNTHGHEVLESVEDLDKRKKLSRILESPMGDGDLNVWKIKWHCSLCYQAPHSQFLGLYRVRGCVEPSLFCGWCWMGLRSLPKFARCPFGCGIPGDLQDAQFAPYPRRLEEVLVEEERQLAIQMAYKRSSAYQRILRYDAFRQKRNESRPIRVSQKELEEDLYMADMAEKDLEKFERSLENKMKALDDEHKKAFNKLIKAFNIDIILHKDIFSIVQAVENGTAFACLWKDCRLKFATKQDLELHKIHAQHFEYVCARPHCQYKTEKWGNFKRHYTNAWGEKTNRKCPDIPDVDVKRKVCLTCHGCGRVFTVRKSLLRHQTTQGRCERKRKRDLQIC